MYDFLSANIPSYFSDATVLNDPAFLAGAFGVFLSAAFVDLALRVRTIRKQKEHRAHPPRMDEALRYIAAQKPAKIITRAAYQKLTRVSAATATHDLQKLEELGLIQRTAEGRRTYRLIISASGQKQKTAHKTSPAKRTVRKSAVKMMKTAA